MKKVINGKMYDTETAKELGMWINNQDYNDFRHICETLYRKRTGEYFLHGAGGPMTRYADAIDNNTWASGERIMPLSMAEAQTWAEEKLTGNEYEAIFGEIVEDDTHSALSITLPNDLIASLRREAGAAGMDLSSLIESKLH